MMELFSELYSCYFQVVAQILREASESPLSQGEIAAIIEQNAFAESGLYLLPRLCGSEWELLKKNTGRLSFQNGAPSPPSAHRPSGIMAESSAVRSQGAPVLIR